MLPSIFGESLLDDWFDFPSERDFFGSHNPVFGKHAKNLMRTDIRETDTSYELDVDLPGFKKEDIKAELKDGYLTITAESSSSAENKDERGTVIHKERYTSSCKRSFFVGEQIRQEDIKAGFENGILKLQVPKDSPKVEDTPKYIDIL